MLARKSPGSWPLWPLYMLWGNIKISCNFYNHDDVIQWKNFPHYWPFVRGIHRSPFIQVQIKENIKAPCHWPLCREFTGHRWIPWSPVNSPHKGQWCGTLMFSLICAWITGWVNNRWFEMPLRPLCHHSNDFMQLYQDVTTYPCPKFNVGLANFWTLESLRGLLFRGPII